MNEILNKRIEKSEVNTTFTECEKRPLITFALFTYNQEKYIEQAVAAAFNQTYSPLQIIISDDASSDNTFQIVKKMAADYKGPHAVITNHNDRNMGVVSHVNKVCLEMAKGELIVLAAGDDLSVPERVEELWQAWDSSNKKAYSISSGYIAIDENGTETHTWMPDKKTFERDKISFITSFGEGFAGATQCVHRDVFDKFGNVKGKAVEDRCLIIRAALLGNTIPVHKALVKYRIHSKSISFASNDILSTRKKLLTFLIEACGQIMHDIKKDCILMLSLDQKKQIEKVISEKELLLNFEFRFLTCTLFNKVILLIKNINKFSLGFIVYLIGMSISPKILLKVSSILKIKN